MGVAFGDALPCGVGFSDRRGLGVVVAVVSAEPDVLDSGAAGASGVVVGRGSGVERSCAREARSASVLRVAVGAAVVGVVVRDCVLLAGAAA